MQEACNRTTVVHPFSSVTSGGPAWRHRHLRQCRIFSTAEPVQRLEAAPHVTQQCQLSATITGQSAAGIGATVDITKSGPVVNAATDVRKRRSNHLQARILS
jgi:hypothetical protein